MSILALHGFTGCGADFAPLAKLYGGKWHCPDLPGHGIRPQLDCSPAATIDFINHHCSICQAQATTPNILLGYSMGARAALLHATQYPQQWDALILISGNPGIENESARSQRRESDSQLAASIERLGIEQFLAFWQETPMLRGIKDIRTDWLEKMQANRLEHTISGLANSLLQFGQGSFPNLWPLIEKLRMPIHLITGALDTKYSQIATRLHQIPNVHTTHTVIENASHMPHLENADASAHVIEQVLKRSYATNKR